MYVCVCVWGCIDVSCPLCRQITPSLAAVVTNYSLVDIITTLNNRDDVTTKPQKLGRFELVSSPSSLVSCTECKNDATAHCTHCGDFCDTCFTSNHTTLSQKRHVRIVLDVKPRIEHKCSMHNESLKLFCIPCQVYIYIFF